MTINPSIQNYINDLLKDNKAYLCEIDSLQHVKIPSMRKRLLGCCELLGMAMAVDNKLLIDELSKESGLLFGRLAVLIARVYENQNNVNKNLEKIKGLRNGTIKEI